MSSLASIAAKPSGDHADAAGRPADASSRLWYAIRVGLGSHSAATAYPDRSASPRVYSRARDPVPTMATRRAAVTAAAPGPR